jgi:hypothetical protein
MMTEREKREKRKRVKAIKRKRLQRRAQEQMIERTLDPENIAMLKRQGVKWK